MGDHDDLLAGAARLLSDAEWKLRNPHATVVVDGLAAALRAAETAPCPHVTSDDGTTWHCGLAASEVGQLIDENRAAADRAEELETEIARLRAVTDTAETWVDLCNSDEWPFHLQRLEDAAEAVHDAVARLRAERNKSDG